MIKKTTHLIFGIVLTIFSYAQTPTLDSLKQLVAQHPQRDTLRVSLIMDYVVAAVNENTTEIAPFLDELISISHKTKYLRGLQSGYLTAQIYYADRGEVATAMRYADSAFRYLNTDTTTHARQRLGFLHNNLAGDYYKLGDYDKALHHYTEAAQLLSKYKPQVMASVYSGMAEVYESLKQLDKAMEFGEKSIAAAEQSGNKSSIHKRYLNHVLRHINRKNFEQAEVLLLKIGPGILELQESFSLILFYQSLGYVYEHKKQYASAVTQFQRAYEVAFQTDDKYQQLVSLHPWAVALMHAGKMNDAKEKLDTLLLQSKRYQMSFAELNAYGSLADWHSKQGNYATAIQYMHQRQALSDSINSEKLQEAIARQEARFKVQAQDQAIALLQRENQVQQFAIQRKNTITYILIGGALMLALMLFLLFRNFKQKQRIQSETITKLTQEKKLNATELVLKGEEQERSRLAKDLHDGLGGMLSGVKHSLNTVKGNLMLTEDTAHAFDRSLDMIDTSIQEMRRLAHNMMPEALIRFGLDTALRDFCNGIHQSGALMVTYQSIGVEGTPLDQRLTISIYRITQELVHNIVKHAQATSALVQLTRSQQCISLTIEDDGKGFDPSQLPMASGIGWKNIQSRVDYLQGTIDIQSSTGKGTSVHLEIEVV